ncbi:FAD-binding oxidoreductase [Sphingomonas sp.]|uniref:NAD(P)/FAD-dependent oxidoreductase n=1 Tax=Sphingomonas sp. TaxID=28214 RepID=UPI0025CE02E0|nr:FAD-binding oxidoreductase [Sphingomonas sp.]
MNSLLSRRALLARTGLGIAVLAAAPLRAAAGAQVVVIGGGIIGASIAYHLAMAGARVTVLEAEKPAAGATMNSFAWLNAGNKRPRPYHMLNLLGMMGWHRLQSELGATALPVQWGGCVDWASDEADARRAAASVLAQQGWGYPIRSIEADEVTRLLPGITPGPIAGATFSDAEGTVNPVIATQALLRAAAARGAKIEYPVKVTGFESGDGRVSRVLTDKGAIAADAVVIAGGMGCQPLAAMLGAKVPLESTPGILAHSVSRPIALGRLAYGPGANIKQTADGGFVTGENFGVSKAPPTREVGEALLAKAASYVPAIRGAKLDFVTLGHRVLPKDSFPIVGHLPGSANAYVAAMHSGMTMAPLIGQLAAIEVLGGPKADLLTTFRPERFA